MKTAYSHAFLALVAPALSFPINELAARQFGGGSSTGGGFPTLPSGLPGGFPGTGTSGGFPGTGTSGGFPGLPSGISGGFPGFPGTGTGTGTSGGFPGLPTGTSGGFPGTGTSGGFPGLPTGIGSGTSLPGGSGGSSTENDVTDNAGCKALTVIFARGTGEAGNVGTVAGPPFFAALKKDLGDDKVAVQGVDYPASTSTIVGGGSGGSTMASLVQQAKSQCPDTKIVLSGYSQGGEVVHSAVSSSGFDASSVAGAVLFGDPEKTSPLTGIPSSDVLEICADGDGVCNGSFAISAAHLSYGSNAEQAAQFAEKVTGITAAS